MTSLTERSASHRYYAAMHGRWRGRISITPTERPVGAAEPPTNEMGVMDRLAWRMTFLNERLFGAPWLETSVDSQTGAARGVVVHTTLLRQLGMPLVWGREILKLAPDGSSFTLSGWHRFPWRLWWAREVRGTGMVRADARGAHYTFDYLGTKLVQTTHHESADLLVVRQETPFSRGTVRLERR